ncbi:MAG TPA: methyltransferase domain-containing protein [Thermoleophilaceae bacterium]|nr:methyltransferase domain-containing protein [Thermoleophilaceae bacterium]
MAEAASESRWGESVNAEAITAWDGPLFDRFVKFRYVLVAGLGAHGAEALRSVPLQPGQRVLDVGCGFGDTTQTIAERVGESGEAVGVDASERFIETARSEAEEAGVTNASFAVADAQTDPLGEGFDGVFSRMGTMFFANPVVAMRNVRRAMVPGGWLSMVVWRRREDNAWLYRAQRIVEGFLSKPEEHDDPTCGPGPFSMSGADTTSDIMLHAGFTDVSLRRCDLPVLMGRNEDEAVDLVMSLGPAGEILRLAGDSAAHLHGDIDTALREALSEYTRPNGEVWAPASTWIVTATAPADGA